MADQQLRIRIILILAIGAVLVFRSFMRPDTIIFGFALFGFDLIGLAGLTCLSLGLILAYRRRHREGINSPS